MLLTHNCDRASESWESEMCCSVFTLVSHHDPDLTFNHSFIEQPSSGWVIDSFETDDDGEAIYCEPPREGRQNFK